MAPRSEDDTMKAITSDFFGSVSANGHPATKQSQSQKWKELGLPQPAMKKEAGHEDSKMIVMCGTLHDYGEPQPIPLTSDSMV